MNKLSGSQFCALMLINDVFVLFCLTGGISLVTAAGFALGAFLQLIAFLPVLCILRKGRQLRDCGRIAELTALFSVIAWGGMLFSMLWHTGGLVFVPFENTGIAAKLLITGLAGIVCVYISSSGIKALARSGVIAAAAGAVCLAIAAVSALIQSDPDNLRAADDTGLFHELIKGFSLSGGLSGAAVMLGFVKNDPRKTAVRYFVGKAVVSAAVIAVGVLVCGGIMKIIDYPVISAAQLSQPFPSQRIDSLFLIIYTVFAVYSIAVQASAAELLLGELMPKIKKYRCTLMLGAMAAAGAIFGGRIFFGLPFALASLGTVIIAPLSYQAGRLRS